MIKVTFWRPCRFLKQLAFWTGGSIFLLSFSISLYDGSCYWICFVSWWNELDTEFQSSYCRSPPNAWNKVPLSPLCTPTRWGAMDMQQIWWLDEWDFFVNFEIPNNLNPNPLYSKRPRVSPSGCDWGYRWPNCVRSSPALSFVFIYQTSLYTNLRSLSERDNFSRLVWELNCSM